MERFSTSNLQDISQRLTSPVGEATDIPPPYQAARRMIETHLGHIVHAERALGGLVSYVYKVTGEKGRGIVKVKGTHLAEVPQISIHPKDAQYEWRALQFLSQIEPTTFPHPIAFHPDTSTLVMTDVMPNGKNLQERFLEGEVHPTEMHDVGQTMARLHGKLSDYTADFRDEGDEQMYHADLKRRMGMLANQPDQTLERLYREVLRLPQQLIVGDISPKNIGRGEHGQITICDLESFYQGQRLFAYGYLTGHILLRTMQDIEFAQACMSHLLEGFASADPATDLQSPLLQKIALGASLYRLQNTLVPFPIDLTPEARRKKVKTAHSLLERKRLNWPMVISQMTRL